MNGLGEFDFKQLFIFEMANNHQGDVSHGLRIIDEFAALAKREDIRAAMKFQMRDLPSFVHPAHRKQSTSKHIDRFLSTRLTRSEFEKLVDAARDAGLILMCTPFDEASISEIADLGIEVLKIGSPSAKDWPLIEGAAESGLPIVFSTGGLSLIEIDDLVSFFDHRKVEYAMMHCVSIYPTPRDALHLAQLTVLGKRYPGRVIGYSGHEDPDDILPVQIATALGAEIFERHVGIATDRIGLNAYSMTPEQTASWIHAHKHAAEVFGGVTERRISLDESASLLDLRRGIYARHALTAGALIDREDVYFSMPCGHDQVSAGEWRDGIVALEPIAKDAALERTSAAIPDDAAYQRVYSALHSVKAMLNEAQVALPSDFALEISHHYGMESFREVGVVLIDCVNRAYCKKILVQLPGQRHPLHYHKRKEETFQLLHGVLELEVDDRRRTMYPGDTLLILPGVWHSFWTNTGAIFEEISTTHFDDDSFYADKVINRMQRSERKTMVKHWGRHQLER